MAGFSTVELRAAYGYLSASADITVTTGGTFVDIDGTFDDQLLEQFIRDRTEVIYDGFSDAKFKIDWTISLSSEDAGRLVHVGARISREGLTTSTAGVQSVYAENADQIYSLSGTRVVTLADADPVEFQLTSDTDGDVITITGFNFSITEIRGN